MRKRLLQNFLLLLSWGLLAIPIQAEMTSYFLVVDPSVDYQEQRARIESSQGRLRQSVPPSIFVAEFPSEISPEQISGIKMAYAGIVPLETLDDLGPLATAAGVNWNKLRVKEGRSISASGVMSARDISRATLPAPRSVIAHFEAGTLSVSWSAVTGALLYEVQLSELNDFSMTLTLTRTDRLEAHLPISVRQNETIYIRARALDRPSATDASNDIEGNWSAISSIGVTPSVFSPLSTTPILTSPLDRYQTSGFTLLLEWTQTRNSKARVQVAKHSDFSTLLIDQITTEKEFAVPSSALHVGDTLYWRVQNWGPDQSPFSTSRSVIIGEPSGHQEDTFINPEMPR